ncbi:CRISPR-associated endoribonuclease Cas6 [Roseimarinus sediminis]|uniref:CRISPR-associated endoribonuclease Cas6 n=1 Tax=Roseimarinus sediminis TaxID=1610899 RepID=UPI003D1C84DB
MRIHLKINTANELIPFDHQPLLTGTIHKWLGWNEEHGKVSLYSFSRLEGGKATPKGLRFERGTSIFISTHHPDLIKQLIRGIQADPTLFHGLSVLELIIQEDPDLSDRELFFVASPIFIKRSNGEKIDHIVYDDPRANVCLQETLQTKMKKAGLSDDSLSIRFDLTYLKAGTKKITYNEVENRASWCPVIIEGKPETKLFAWNVGLGNSTGIGFGAIK